MTETRPVQSVPPSSDASTYASDRRHLQQHTVVRFREALSEPGSSLLDPANPLGAEHSGEDAAARANAARRSSHAAALAGAERHDINTAATTGAEGRIVSIAALPGDAGNSTTIDAERRGLSAVSISRSDPGEANTATVADRERRDLIFLASAVPATVGSLHYSLPVTQATPELPTAASNVETVRLIEQATSVLMERSSRADASRFIVSLDHAIVGGASAEFVRDGAFLHVRLLARNDAAYRSMWANRVELEERLAASTGLVTRVEISEGYGDGRSA